MCSERISIIVPVYKVEQYLDKCIQSIVEQTYTNLEIILVDDGSPDNCPAMCDAWAKQDSRIKVIHKENGGLSDARNAGMRIAIGEYIAFVDSDDWIEKEYISAMYNALKDTNSDIAACNVRWIWEEKTAAPVSADAIPYRICNSEQAITELIENRGFRQVVWNKLYRRNLLENIRFPKGRFHEDEYFTYRVLAKTEHLVYVDVPLYNYFQRAGSIMRTSHHRHCMDTIDAYYERLNFLQCKYPALYHREKAEYCVMCVAYYRVSIFEWQGDNAAIQKWLKNSRKRVRFTLKELLTYSLKDQHYIVGSKICIGLTSWLLEARIRRASKNSTDRLC